MYNDVVIIYNKFIRRVIKSNRNKKICVGEVVYLKKLLSVITLSLTQMFVHVSK